MFVITWWITGTMAIACYTAAFVWTMEICAGELKMKFYLFYDDIFPSQENGRSILV